MENNDWSIILPLLKEMFNFDDDLLWTVYFNCNMNLDKTIDTLIEISQEENKISNFDVNSSKMSTFDDFKEKNKSIQILSKIKNSLTSITRRSHKYKKIDNDSND